MNVFQFLMHKLFDWQYICFVYANSSKVRRIKKTPNGMKYVSCNRKKLFLQKTACILEDFSGVTIYFRHIT